jgi:hypothetical protein
MPVVKSVTTRKQTMKNITFLFPSNRLGKGVWQIWMGFLGPRNITSIIVMMELEMAVIIA